MANEPSWDELFNPQPKASEPAPAPFSQQPEPGLPAAAQPAQEPAADTDPFAALFAGFGTDVTPVQSAPAAPVPVQAPVQQPAQQPAQQRVQQRFPPDWAPQATAPVNPVLQPPVAQQPTPPPMVQNSDPFADMFASQPGMSPASSSSTSSFSQDGSAPLTRRELREREAQGASAPAAAVMAGAAVFPAAAPVTQQSSPPESGGFPFDFGVGNGNGGNGSGNGSSGAGGGYYPPEKPRKRRSLLWLKISLPIVLVLGALGGAAAFVWLNYEDQVRELMGWQLPNDFLGSGNGVEVIVTIQSGEIGSDVASTLHDKGVTMTFDAFYDLLLAQPDNVNFLPGNYALQKQMSAQSALDALLDPASKVTSKLLLTEGTTLPSALEIMAETTGIPLEEFQAAAADYQQFGLPAQAPSLEGYLFPATYELDGTETAVGLLQLLVDTMFEHLDDAGVPVEQRHEILTKASIIQREAGPNQDDFYKIARVFQNRLDQGINLQSDATVAYGTGNLQTVWTTDDERADASNLYNTYANPGLPIGPIGLPGDLAIDAALKPADGPWLFFVPINLATGETVFSETADEHEAAVQVLRDWCDASPENASYCE